MTSHQSDLKFSRHLQTYDRLHDQPSKMFMEHLGKDYIHSSTAVRSSRFPTVDGDWSEPGICRRCWEEGIWVNGECVCGCVECVKTNDWTWGIIFIIPEDEDEPHMVSIPCNGSRLVGADETPTEYTNLELILKVLTDIWDHVPDWATENPETVPRWSKYFDISPERTHAIICKELNLWRMPETARNLPMEPGQPWALQNLLPDPNVLDEISGGINDPEPRQLIQESVLDEMSDDEISDLLGSIPIRERINGLEPRQLFQDDDDEEERKELCTEGQKLLDATTGEAGVFNEESYRLLSNILMKIHQL